MITHRVRVETRWPVGASMGDHVHGYITGVIRPDQLSDYLDEIKVCVENQRFLWITTDLGIDAMIAVTDIVCIEVMTTDTEGQ